MPERNTDETTKRLVPLLTDPNLQQKVDEAAGKTVTAQQGNADAMQDQDMTMTANTNKEVPMKKVKAKAVVKDNNTDMAATNGNNKYVLSQVIGIIIGSPEYQRK
jgi:bisphosphoglycerate-independent phosphoglycerate mutase (AlkP superfamily)